MMLDGTLEGRYPGVVLIVGRDRSGRVQAFHRYVTSGAEAMCRWICRGVARMHPTGSTSG